MKKSRIILCFYFVFSFIYPQSILKGSIITLRPVKDYKEAKKELELAKDLVVANKIFFSFCAKHPNLLDLHDLLHKVFEMKKSEIKIVDIIKDSHGFAEYDQIKSLIDDFLEKYPEYPESKMIEVEMNSMKERIKYISELVTKIKLAQCLDELKIIRNEDVDMFKEIFEGYDANYHFINDLLEKAKKELHMVIQEKVEKTKNELESPKSPKEIERIKSGFTAKKCYERVWEKHLSEIADRALEEWRIAAERAFKEAMYDIEKTDTIDEVILVYDSFKSKYAESGFLIALNNAIDNKIIDIVNVMIKDVETVDKVNDIFIKFSKIISLEKNKIKLYTKVQSRINILKNKEELKRTSDKIFKNIEDAITNNELDEIEKELDVIKGKDLNFANEMKIKIKEKRNEIAYAKIKKQCDDIFKNALNDIYSANESNELERLKRKYNQIFDVECSEFGYKIRFDNLASEQFNKLREENIKNEFYAIKSKIEGDINICEINEIGSNIERFNQDFPESEYVSKLKELLGTKRLKLEELYHLQLENAKNDIAQLWHTKEILEIDSNFKSEFPCDNYSDKLNTYVASRIEVINIAFAEFESIKKNINKEKQIGDLDSIEKGVEAFKLNYPDNLLIAELLNQLELKRDELMKDALNEWLRKFSQKVNNCNNAELLTQLEHELIENESEYLPYGAEAIENAKNKLEKKRAKILKDIYERKVQAECLEYFTAVKEDIHYATNRSELDAVKDRYANKFDAKCEQYKGQFESLLKKQYANLYNQEITKTFNTLKNDITIAKDICILNKIKKDSLEIFIKKYPDNQYIANLAFLLDKKRLELERLDLESKTRIMDKIDKIWILKEVDNIVSQFWAKEPCNHYLKELDNYMVLRKDVINQALTKSKSIEENIIQAKDIDHLADIRDDLEGFKLNYSASPFVAALEDRFKKKHDKLQKEELEQKNIQLSQRIDNAINLDELIQIENQLIEIGKRYLPYGRDSIAKLNDGLVKKRNEISDTIRREKQQKECNEILDEIEKEVTAANDFQLLDDIRAQYSSKFHDECIDNIDSFEELLVNQYKKLRKDEIELSFNSTEKKISEADDLCELNKIKTNDMDKFVMNYKDNKEYITKIKKRFDEKRSELKKADFSNYETIKMEIIRAEVIENVQKLVTSFKNQFSCSDYLRNVELDGEKRIFDIKERLRLKEEKAKEIAQEYLCDDKDEIIEWLAQYEKAWETEDIQLLEKLGHKMDKKTRKRIINIFEQRKMHDVIITIKHIRINKDDCSAEVMYKQFDKFVDDVQGYVETPSRKISKTLKKKGKDWVWIKN